MGAGRGTGAALGLERQENSSSSSSSSAGWGWGGHAVDGEGRNGSRRMRACGLACRWAIRLRPAPAFLHHHIGPATHHLAAARLVLALLHGLVALQAGRKRHQQRSQQQQQAVARRWARHHHHHTATAPRATPQPPEHPAAGPAELLGGRSQALRDREAQPRLAQSGPTTPRDALVRNLARPLLQAPTSLLRLQLDVCAHLMVGWMLRTTCPLPTGLLAAPHPSTRQHCAAQPQK